MASLKPLFSIKECSSCGSLYTRECCSIGSLENKILVPEPDSSPCCAKCGTLVDGPYCRGCALLQKGFKEDLLTYCVEDGIFQDSQDTFESSDDNTNVINALQEPIVVNQDLGIKSSQGAHYGYNCPPKVPIISNPEQCNQTIAEFPQTLPIVHATCNYENENSFINDSKLNSSNDFPSVLTHPPQLQFETYLCDLCGNNAHYGYDCPPQFPFKEEERRIVEEQAAKEDMSIEEIRHEQQLVDYQIKDITNDLGYKRFRGEKIDEEYERDCSYLEFENLSQDFK
ncbi:hypothetical protein Tco_0226559 [Tanacetum coccineum]